MALKYLDETHYRAIELLLERRPKTEIAETLGVHRNTITNWLKEPIIEQELKKAVIRRTHSRLGELVDAMMDTAISQGNAAMAKLILQANGLLTDKISVENKRETSNEVDYDRLDSEIEAFGKRLEEDGIEH